MTVNSIPCFSSRITLSNKIKFGIAVLAAVCLLCLTGCSSQADDVGPMELRQISGLVSEKGYTEEYFEAELAGQSRDDIIDLWGEPDGALSGFWGDTWNLDDNINQRIILYYNKDGIVENVRITDIVLLGEKTDNGYE